MVGGDMRQDQRSDLVVAPAAGNVAAFTSNLPEYFDSSQSTSHLTPSGSVALVPRGNIQIWINRPESSCAEHLP
jgi:hypothetical protein